MHSYTPVVCWGMVIVAAFHIGSLSLAVTLNIKTYDASLHNINAPPELQQIAIDQYTGNVYVGGRNLLLKLDNNLTLMEKLRAGPIKDHFNCTPSDSDCDLAVLTDNDMKVLDINHDLGMVLACGSVKQGLCTLYSLETLSKTTHLYPDNVINYVGGKRSAFAFFGRGPSALLNPTVLYSAQEYDGRPMALSPKALSSRRLVNNQELNRINMSYVVERPDIGTHTAIDIDRSVKDTYLVKYIYGFEHRKFSYFLTIQKAGIYSNVWQTRLVRLCQDDYGFYSYTEIPLACRKNGLYNNGNFGEMNLAQAGYMGPIGNELANRYNIDNDSEILYVIFGRSRNYPHSGEADPRKGTALCFYPMDDIRKAFTRAQKDCYQGYGRLLAWIYHNSPKCTYKPGIAQRIDDDFCGYPTNVGIGARYALSTTANMSTTEYFATAVGVVVYQTKTIAVLGTSRGDLVKVLIDGSNSAAYAVLDVSGENDASPVKPDIAFDSTQKQMFLMAGSKVVRVPVQSCQVYNECSTCVTAKDPLGCGWCDNNHCSTRKECMATWQPDSCSPVIHSFEPENGPLKGGTKVTIYGHLFGAARPAVKAKVKVALVDCQIIFHNATVIRCITGPSDAEIERDIRVTIHDRTKATVNFTINGEANSEEKSFSYKEPHATRFTPELGPRSGKTNLSIYGQNLDIGLDLSVTVMGLPCAPYSISGGEVKCTTSPWITNGETIYHITDDTRHKRSLGTGSVNITIDGQEITVPDRHFSYEEDPTIIDLSPTESIISGGLPITVKGTNLHVINKPKMVAKIVEVEGKTLYQGECYPKSHGNMMVCESPNISQTSALKEKDKRITVDLRFQMDGVAELWNFPETHPHLARFYYVVDPEFLQFPDVRILYEWDDTLSIKGRYLRIARIDSSIRITVGNSAPCNLTKLTNDEVFCVPPRPRVLSPNEPERKVEVRVGNLFFDIGHVKFAKYGVNVVLAMALGPTVGAILVVVTVIVVVYMKKTHKGPFRYKRKTPSDANVHVRYSPGRQMNGADRQRQQEEAVFRMNTHENPYWRHGGQNHLYDRYRQAAIGATAAPPTAISLESIIDDESRRLIEDSNLLIDRDMLILGEVIGQGHFGCVYKGFLKVEGEKEEVDVAVKTLKSLTEHEVGSLEGKKFVKEALMMRDFDHPHILRLIGIALEKNDTPLVVLPFMKHGDLLSYIREEYNSPTVKELMDFGIQVAEGMAYLSNLKFVHRDLAARNCMLDDQRNIKVADFGLSRDIYERDYYSSDDRKAKLPVKWMALESLEKGIYNIKTDVWSYGVVLWELMTRGVCPYPEVDNWDIIKYLKSGRRMLQPSYCPDTLYEVMLRCWNPDPKDRPSFETLVFRIRSIIETMQSVGQHQKVGLNVTYINVPTVTHSQGYLYPRVPGIITTTV